MKKSFLLFATAALSLLFTSCQQEIDGTITDIDTTVSYRLKTYTEDITSASIGNSITVYNLSYDANNRLISMISRSNAGNKFVYSYPSATHYTMDIYGNNLLTIHEDFFANSSLNLDSTFQYNDTKDSSTEKYIYNASNQLMQVLEYEYSAAGGAQLFNTTGYTYDANGNIIRTQDTHGHVETYEYYADLVYPMPVTTGFFSTVTEPRNLVKKHTVTVGGSMEGSVDITYTFDLKNRISSERAVGLDGSVVVKTYTYF